MRIIIQSLLFSFIVLLHRLVMFLAGTQKVSIIKIEKNL